MDWLKREQNFVLGALGVGVLWLILYYALVAPAWGERQTELEAAQAQLDHLTQLTAKHGGSWAKPDAEAELKKAANALDLTIKELGRIEMGDLGSFKLAAAGSTDHKTYFSMERRRVTEWLEKADAPSLGPGLADDLSFKELANTDPVGLNLIRLYILQRFVEAARDAHVQDILSLQYPAPMALPRPEGMDIERLIQVPLIVRVRARERDFGRLLCELQPSAQEPRFQQEERVRYLCLRGFQMNVKDLRSFALEGVVAVGGLFPEGQFKKQINDPNYAIREEERPGGFRPLVPDANRY